MRCWTARLNTVGLLCASVLRTWIFADLTALSLLFNSSVTLASFHQQRADPSSLKTTMSPTLMDRSIAPVLFRWYSRNPKRCSSRRCLVKPSSKLKWYLALFVNDWNVLMTLQCLWCGWWRFGGHISSLQEWVGMRVLLHHHRCRSMPVVQSGFYLYD